jgi:protease-4
MAQAIADAVDDPAIPAIVLRLDSPGGSYVASDTIRRELARAAAEGVPVVVSMSNLAASGGYFIAASGAKIVAQPTTITGSIGVIGGKFVLDGFWQKLGIGHASVKAGQNSDFWSPNRDFTPEAAAKFEGLLDETYADFMAKVAQGRDLSEDAVHALAKGQVWSGADAKEHGLVDALGGYDAALEMIRSEAGIDPTTKIRLEAYPAPRDPFTALVEDFFGSTAETGAIAKMARGLSRLAAAMEMLEPLTDTLGEQRVPLQMRAPEMQIR